MKKTFLIFQRLLSGGLLLMLSLWVMGQDSTNYLQDKAVSSVPDLHLSVPVSSGNNQQQMVDFTLPEPIRVLVTDGEGQPVPGSTVFFRTASQP